MALGAIILVLASFIHQRPLRIYIYIYNMEPTARLTVLRMSIQEHNW